MKNEVTAKRFYKAKRLKEFATAIDNNKVRNRMRMSLMMKRLCARLCAAFFILHSSFFISSCSSSDDDKTTTVQAEETTLNIDVILPTAQWTAWQPTIKEAVGNIDRGQQTCQKRVKLNLRFHDEDTSDLERLAYDLAHPGSDADTCHAIVGPYHSANARTILNQAQRTRLPVVMPCCTSAELQRSEARQTNSFFFTESDITQCEVLLTAIAELGYQRVALLYSDDTYGQSYRDWFGFLATQSRLNVVPGGIRAYTPGDNLTEYFTQLKSTDDPDDFTITALIIALGETSQYTTVLNAWQQVKEGNGYVMPFVTDTGLSTNIQSYPVLGTYPIGSSNEGFQQEYYLRNQANTPYGAAQMYDALCAIALGRAAQLHAADPDQLYIDGERVEYETAPFGPGLSDWMRAVLATEETAVTTTSWTGYDLANAFRLIEGGILPSLHGATGELNFDAATHTTILNTNYLLWASQGGQIMPLATLSTDGYTSISTKNIWEWQAYIEDIDPNEGDAAQHDLPAINDRWAVVISPSTTWANYRHQADALAMYQLLRHHGYDDDHIVLIVEDNLANDSRNPFTGEVYVERGTAISATDLINDNVRKNAVVDYHFSDLRPDDLLDIMQGRQSDRLPHVIHPTAADNVFFFWSGHGADLGGPLWGNEDCREPFGTDRILRLLQQMQQPRQYRRMLLAIETCYSGQWGEALTGQPDVLVLTAANAYETSKPDAYDSELRNYLSNAFARSFRQAVNQQPHITLRDLYYQLARTTAGSHVSLYNIANYGSVYQNTMQDYIPE